MDYWFQRRGDPIRIVPAADLRPSSQTRLPGQLNAQTLRTDPQTSTNGAGQNPAEIPINATFYPPINPYGGFVRNYQAHAWNGSYPAQPFNSAEIGNTLNPTLRKYQRYRTPPSRHANFQRHRASTGRIDQTTGTLDNRYVRSFSGPLKRPAPIYQKKRDPRPNSYHLAETYGTLYNKSTAWPYASNQDPYADFAPPLFYVQPPAAYGTIPPKVGRKLRKKEERLQIEEAYPLAARLGIKLAELVFGLVIVGLVLLPTRGTNLAEFLRKSETEWQAVLLVTVACLAVVTFFLLITICCANRRLFWRRIDIVNSAISSFLYLVLTCIETYYAACYPPNGIKINLVCYRIEWIVAAVICFFQIVIYLTDMIMGLRTGVSLL